MIFKVAALFLLVLTPAIHCANILMLPVPHYSYVNSMCTAGIALKRAGHKVTVIVQDIHKDKVEERGIDTLSYVLSEEGDLPNFVPKLMGNQGSWQIMKNAVSLKGLVTKMCQDIIENKEVREGIEKGNFDLVFLNNINVAYCIYALPYKYGLPYISFGTMPQTTAAGIPVLPTSEPPFLLSAVGEFSLVQRLMAPFAAFMWDYIVPMYYSSPTIFNTLAPNREPISFEVLLANSSLFLSTLDTSCFGAPKVTAPNLVYIGSLTGKDDVKRLPDDMAKFAESSIQGLVITAFGTMKPFREFVVSKVQPVIKALESVKENAIIQCDPSYFDEVEIPPNIMLRKWLPQTALFAHANTKLFISHGGINGLMEATYHGIPVLTLPWQQEQVNNGQLMERKKYGKMVLNISDSELIHQNVREIIDNPQYKENIQKCADILDDLPDGRETLVYWTNHVLKFGGSHLRHGSANMPFYKAFMLDVLFILLSLFFVTTYLVIKCGSYALNKISKCIKPKEKEN